MRAYPEHRTGREAEVGGEGKSCRFTECLDTLHIAEVETQCIEYEVFASNDACIAFGFKPLECLADDLIGADEVEVEQFSPSISVVDGDRLFGMQFT